MFCVVYEFEVIPEQEDKFKKLWHEITMEVIAHDGGLGSRLHKMFGKKNAWIGYAQWPTREDWLQRAPLTLDTARAEKTKEIQKTCNSISALLELDVIDDLLVHNQP